MATIAMQYIVDFAITHIPGISGGGMASIEVPPARFLGVQIEGDLPTYWSTICWSTSTSPRCGPLACC
jgi:branched-chain amino acid transport system permease protein